MNDEEKHMFLFNTYNTANGQTITPAQLEMSNSVLHPQERINLKVEVAKTYRTLISYTKGFNVYLSEPTVSLKSFQDPYGILYFNLTKQKEKLKRGSAKLELCLVVQMLDLVCMLLLCMREKSVLRL